MSNVSNRSRSDCSEPVRASPSLHWSAQHGWEAIEEAVAVEAPLAIEVSYERNAHRVHKLLAVTMRTPGHDQDLATGFLFAEGLLRDVSEIVSCEMSAVNSRGENMDTVNVRLGRAPREDLQRVSRGLITSAACGLCGRVSLEGLSMRPVSESATLPRVSCETLVRLPEALREFQSSFHTTGGTHGAALCTREGAVTLVREDVGRHNAVDKLVGAALTHRAAADEQILVLSGRASFELVQKASAFGVPLVVAVGAPSSLAVTLADSTAITLVGFTRRSRLNVYTHAWRLTTHDASISPVAQAART